MTPREAAFVARLQRRAGSLSPDMARDLLRAYDAIRQSLSTADIERAIASGQLDAIIDDALLDRSLIPFRAKLQQAVERGFNAVRIDLPKGGKIDGQVAVAFDKLNPEIITAVRELDSRVMNTVKADIRDVIRGHVENGLRDGVAPRTIAREIKSYVGLAPNQAQAVENYRKALEGEGRNPLDYQLRDRRYDAAIRRGPKKAPGSIVAWHGTAAEFDSFDPSLQGQSFRGVAGDRMGFWATANKEQAGKYAEIASSKLGFAGKPHVMRVAISLKRPYVIDAQTWAESGTSTLPDVETLRRMGYDGAVVDRGIKGKEYMAINAGDIRILKPAVTPEQIDRAVEVYRRKMEAFHANTVARTAAVDAQKLGQRLSWQDAIDKGVVGADTMYRTWITVGDDRVRPEHEAMSGEEVPFDQHYSNGELVPGESAWNCRCVERYTVKRKAA